MVSRLSYLRAFWQFVQGDEGMPAAPSLEATVTKRLLFPLLMVIAACSVVNQAKADVTQEIIQRCRAQMQQYGSAIVKACVDQDIEALRALNTYPEIHRRIINRCNSQMKEYGYAIVKACADQDIEAERALKRY